MSCITRVPRNHFQDYAYVYKILTHPRVKFSSKLLWVEPRNEGSQQLEYCNQSAENEK